MLLLLRSAAAPVVPGPSGPLVVLMVDGNDRTSKMLLNQMTIDMTMGSDWTATLSVRDTDSTSSAYRPSLDESLTITDDTTVLFHGNITRVQDKPIVSPSIGTLTTITARARSQVVDQIIVNETYAAGLTQKAVVTDLHTTYLTPYGIGIDATMTDGVTLEAQTYTDVTLREVFNRLSALSGDVWRITPTDELQFFTPGVKLASYGLTAANHLAVGPVTWEKSRQQYVNSVYLRYGTETVVTKTQTITGDGVTDEWALDYDSVRNADNYILSAGYVTDNGVFSPLSPYPGVSTNWQFDPTTNHLLRTSGALGLGQIATLVYSAQFPQVIVVEDAGEIASNGRFEAIFEAPDIFDKTPATELANGLLRRALAVPQWVRLSTRQGFVMPGDQITLSFADRTIGGDHLITQVRVTTIGNGLLFYDLTCLSGGEAQATWKDQLRSAIGAGGSNAPGGTITGSVVPHFGGHFDNDVIGNTGLNDVASSFESALTKYTNSAGAGPALRLGRNDADYRWTITADSDHGSTPGAVGKLRFHVPRRGSSIECAMSLAEPDTGGTDDFVVLPGVSANLYLGDYAALMSGLSPSDSRIEGVLCANAMATSGYFERSRTTRMGEWIPVSFSAGNFTANGAQTWTVASGDQITYAYSMVGKTMKLSIYLDTTTVAGTPNTELRVAIPGGFTAARIMGGPTYVVDNGAREIGQWGVSASGSVVAFTRFSGGNWSAAANTTYLRTVAEFEVT